MTDPAPVSPIVPPEPPTLSSRRLRALLRRLGACEEARVLIGDRDGRTAWAESERGDHLLWLATRVGVDRRLLARAAVACVQPAVTAYVPADEPRPQAALDAVRRWADDPSEENLERVWVARRAATYAATYAADATYAATYAAAAAADAARHEARAQSLRASARIVRELIPFEVVLAAATGTRGVS